MFACSDILGECSWGLVEHDDSYAPISATNGDNLHSVSEDFHTSCGNMGTSHTSKKGERLSKRYFSGTLNNVRKEINLTDVKNEQMLQPEKVTNTKATKQVENCPKKHSRYTPRRLPLTCYVAERFRSMHEKDDQLLKRQKSISRQRLLHMVR